MVKYLQRTWRGLKRRSREWDSSLEICFVKGVLYEVRAMEGYKWKWKKTPSPSLAASCVPLQGPLLFSGWQSYCCIHNFHSASESFKVKGVKNERRLLLLLLLSLCSLFRIIIWSFFFLFPVIFSPKQTPTFSA